MKSRHRKRIIMFRGAHKCVQRFEPGELERNKQQKGMATRPGMFTTYLVPNDGVAFLIFSLALVVSAICLLRFLQTNGYMCRRLHCLDFNYRQV